MNEEKGNMNKIYGFAIAIISLMLCVCSTHAQNISWTGEGFDLTTSMPVRYYMYNVGKAGFVKSQNSFTKDINDASIIVVNSTSEDKSQNNADNIMLSSEDFNISHESFANRNFNYSKSSTEYWSHQDYQMAAASGNFFKGTYFQIYSKMSFFGDTFWFLYFNSSQLATKSQSSRKPSVGNEYSWQFITESQYKALTSDPLSIMRADMNSDDIQVDLNSNIGTYYSSNNMIWMASQKCSTKDSENRCIKLEVSNVPQGRYKITLRAYSVASSADATVTYVANDAQTVVNSGTLTNVPTGSKVEIDNVTVKESQKHLTFYVKVDDPRVSDVYVALDGIEPLHKQKENLPNNDFELGISENWTVTGFNSADEKAKNMFSNPTVFPQCYSITTKDKDGKFESGYKNVSAGNVYRSVQLKAGSYTLSATTVAINRVAYLYAIVNGNKQKLTFTGGKKKRSLSFVVPSGGEVTIGFEHFKENSDPFTGYSQNDATKNYQFVAIDDVQLLRNGDAEGADISCQLINASLANNNGIDDNGLDVTKYGWINGTSWSTWKNGCAQAPSGDTDVCQSIDGLPAGWYKIKMQGFHRDGNNSSATDKKSTYLYANNMKSNVEYVTSTEITSEDKTKFSDNGYPKDISEASVAFDLGYYSSNEVLVRLDKDDSELKIGVNKTGVTNDFLVCNDFTLLYMGEDMGEQDCTDKLENPSFEEPTSRDSDNKLLIPGWTFTNPEADKSDVVDNNTMDRDKVLQLIGRNSKNEYKLSQSIRGLEAGNYKVSVDIHVVQSYKLTGSVTLKCLVNGITEGVKSTTHPTSRSNVGTTFTLEFAKINIQSLADELTIELTTTEGILVDHFTLSKTGNVFYLYNREAGMFMSESQNTELYPATANVDATISNRSFVALNTVGTKFVVDATNGDNAYKIAYVGTDNIQRDLFVDGASSDNGGYWDVLSAGNINDKYVEGHSAFYVEDKETGSHIFKMCYYPTNELYGTSGIFNKNNALEYAPSDKSYGATYVGWTGETSYLMINPLIPSADVKNRGVEWLKISPSKYEEIQSIIESASEARRKAWPILKSKRNSTKEIEFALEQYYYDLESTSEEILEAIEDAKQVMLNAASSATEDEYVDLSFLISDGECQNMNFASALANGQGSGSFYPCDYSYRSQNKIFGGVFYQKEIDSADENNGACKFVKAFSDSNLPDGKYIFALDVNATTNDFGASKAEGAALNAGNYGVIVGNDAGAKFDIKEYSMPFVLKNVGDEIKLAVEVLPNSNLVWIAFDNFRIRYCGKMTEEEKAKQFDSELLNGVLKITGVITDEMKASVDYIFSQNKNANTVDFTEADVQTTDPITVGGKVGSENVLVYTKDSEDKVVNNTTSDKNVVKGAICDNFVITDKSDLVVPTAFTASSVTYSRSVSNASATNKVWGSLVLPFDVSVVSGVEFYTVKEIDGSGAYLRVKPYEDAVAAHHPVLIQSTGDVNISATDVQVYTTDGLPTPDKNDAMCLYGSYVRTGIGVKKAGDTCPYADGLDASDCFYVKDNKFKVGTTRFYNTPFRAYIYKGATSNSQEAGQRFTFLDIVIDNSEVNLIDSLQDESVIEGYYDVRGIKFNTPQPGVNFVHFTNGNIKKIIVR